jgi:glyoxylase-like metal-dependent hydrolase (beta-lactamase superfamily II)
MRSSIQQADFDFWTGETKTADLKASLARACRNLLPPRDRLIFDKDGQEFLPDVTAIGAPGHTVGHRFFNIEAAASHSSTSPI